MLGLLKNHTYSIGIDVRHDSLKLAQLGSNGQDISVIAGNMKLRPEQIEPGSSDWQRWIIENIRLLTTYGDFHGKEVIAAMPETDVFIDHIKMPKLNNCKPRDAIFSKIKQKLPFEPLEENTVMQYIESEQDNVLVMASERTVIDRHLAIYEKAGLSIKSICVWPLALTNCYVKFFGRRKSDLEAIVMLVCIEESCTNVVICRHRNLLYAHSMAIGLKQLIDEQAVSRLVMEITSCKRQFNIMYRNAQLERLIFMSGQVINKDVCTSIARQLEMPAQVGDCLAAVKIAKSCRLGKDIDDGKGRTDGQIDRRDCPVNWAVTFGLSLS
jgi:Tfp pilus assembly PilM family ATPase